MNNNDIFLDYPFGRTNKLMNRVGNYMDSEKGWV